MSHDSYVLVVQTVITANSAVHSTSVATYAVEEGKKKRCVKYEKGSDISPVKRKKIRTIIIV